MFICKEKEFHEKSLFKCISPSYKRTFISVNHIICNIGCLKQTGKKNAVILILSIFFFFFFKFLYARKKNFMKKAPGRVVQSVGHLTGKSGVLGSIPGLATYFRFSFRFFKKGSCQILAKVCARSTG